ncbi:MAG: cysteine desulfurase [Clostridiales bacterium]|nr:cysteine desulfurase [Clostridiales bacterium]
MKSESIYLDYAATTPTDEQVFNAAKPYYTDIFYNPASAHFLGQKANAAVEKARRQCAQAVNANADEIYFTSGGTESINLALCGVGGGLAVSNIEHDATLACAQKLSANGADVRYIKVNGDGVVTPEALTEALGERTALACVMAVNNIVGSVQPIKRLAAAAHSKGVLFFTDAVQAVNSIDIDVKDWGVDMLAVSGHKFYAPKGVGFLYVKRGVKLNPSLVGGNQEGGLRAGTHDVPAIVAMGEAIQKAKALRTEYVSHVKRVADTFVKTLDCGKVIECAEKTDEIVSVVFRGKNGYIDGGRLATALSVEGVCCSVGSACSAGSATPPQTLLAMGVEHASSSVRFSFGRNTTVEQAKRAAQTVNAVVKRF